MKNINRKKGELIEKPDAAHKRISELEAQLTNPKQIEQTLQKCETRYRSLFENMLNGSAYCRMVYNQGRPEDLIFLDVNRSFKSLIGLKDVYGKKMSEIIPGIRESDPELLQFFNQVVLTCNSEKIEIFVDALKQWLSLSVYSLEKEYFVVVFDVITERKQAEKELAESEQRYRLITDNTTDVISTIDRFGTITFISSSHERVLGRGSEVLGRNAFEYIHPEDIPEATALFDEAVKSRRITRHEYRYLTPYQGYIWIESEGRVIDMQGRPACVVVSRDITERKRAEESLKKMEERLQQSHKMEAIGTLAGGIAHDFNNILSAVLGFAELAKMDLEDRERTEGRLDEIIDAGIRARNLVKQILTFSRQVGIKREPMQVAPLIKEALKFLRASLPATIRMRQEFLSSDSTVVADPSQIHQVIMNLCTNAAHAMKQKGGVLDVRLSEVELNNEADLALKELKPGRYLNLVVTDTGSGIPKGIINKIFDPFFTTKERGEGTGMGLSVVHGIVNDMGGAISVYSKPGEGSKFHVFFPKYEEHPIRGDSLHIAAKIGSGKILLVDDEKQIIASAREILERLGYKVVSTMSPNEALKLFEVDPDEFDMVLTDMTMPKMTGLELSEQLLKIRSDIPIVLCTGFYPGVTVEMIRNKGIKELVMKPMIADELANAVYSALNPDKV